MIILSHRGYWQDSAEKNLEVAFERSFSLGFGTETDVRDLGGELVISHDMPQSGCLTVARFFELYRSYQKPLPLAINIKADGLQAPLAGLIQRYGIEHYFVFDMSVPDTLGYWKRGLTYFTRHSEYEPQPPLYEGASGVWMDEFNGHWVNQAALEKHLACGKTVCIVSPDLHRRPYEAEWTDYRGMESRLDGPELMLCTDHPEQARAFFRADRKEYA